MVSLLLVDETWRPKFQWRLSGPSISFKRNMTSPDTVMVEHGGNSDAVKSIVLVSSNELQP